MDELGLLSLLLGEGWGPALPMQDKGDERAEWEDSWWWCETLTSPAPLLAYVHRHTWISMTLSPVHA